MNLQRGGHGIGSGSQFPEINKAIAPKNERKLSQFFANIEVWLVRNSIQIQ